MIDSFCCAMCCPVPSRTTARSRAATLSSPCFRAARTTALALANQFFNAHLSDQMTNPIQPHDFIVELLAGRLATKV